MKVISNIGFWTSNVGGMSDSVSIDSKCLVLKVALSFACSFNPFQPEKNKNKTKKVDYMTS